MNMIDSALLNALGAPAGTTYDHTRNEYNPRPTLWETDWDTFDEYLKVQQTDTNTSIGISTNNIINTVLSVQTTPVPSNVITTLLGNNHNSSSAVSTSASDSTSTSASASAAVLQYQSFLIAAQNNQTSKEVFLQLIQHATSIQKTNLNFINVSSLTKLLHISVKTNNIGTATAIIEYCPQALGHTDNMGYLPIHVAFSYQNLSSTLTSTSTSTSSSEGKQRSDIVRLLIHEGMKHDIGGIHGCGGIFVTGSCNAFEMALYYLRKGSARARERRNNRNLTHNHTHDFDDDDDDDDCDNEWECLRLCYEAAKSTITDFQLINYIITLQVGMERMLGEIVKKYNINLLDTDMNGMTPLVVAIHKKQTSYIKTLLSIQGNCASEAIQLCTIDGKEYTNCFPLHIAVNQGITWDKGLKEIVECNKMALGLVDTTNNLFPFMVAAQWGENPLTDVYSLLRNQPEVVENFIVNNNPQFVVRRKTQRNVISGEYTIHVILGIMLSVILYFVKERLDKVVV